MKKPLGIRLSEAAFKHVKNKTNYSRYIERLINQDIQAEYTKPIVKAVHEELMQNSAFFDELRDRLQVAHTTPKSSEPFTPRPPDPATGYPCCSKATPCKHWTFDGVTDLWTNTLTGATRDT